MTARYLIRFDDICPTMNWTVWTSIEDILRRYEIRPMLAVVPENQDSHLVVDESRKDFWEHVRRWQQMGWAIGLHGLNHLYSSEASGLVGLNNRSEFAGLSFDAQLAKLKSGLSLFASEAVRADLWIAPAHAFDVQTIRALGELGIKTISDGFFMRPITWFGATWVPQQLWKFRRMPFGLWTVCYHHNTWTDSDLRKFESDVRLYSAQITSLSEVLERGQARSIDLMDRFMAFTWLMSLRLKRRLG